MNQIANINTNFLTMNRNIMTLNDIIPIITLSMLLSVILFVTYKFSNTTLTYNKKFNVTLVMIAFIYTILISLIQSNLTLSKKIKR